MITLTTHSQKGFTTVSGFVIDSISKAPLENTTVLVRDVFSNEIITGISSNRQGFFEIYTDRQDFILEIKLIGYQDKKTYNVDILDETYIGFNGKDTPLRIFKPTDKVVKKTCIMYPGASPYAEEHPAMIMLGKIISSLGYIVFIPRIPPLKNLNI